MALVRLCHCIGELHRGRDGRLRWVIYVLDPDCAYHATYPQRDEPLS